MQTDLEFLEQTLLEVPEEQQSEWRLSMQLTEEQACLQESQLAESVSESLYSIYDNASTGVEAVFVESYSVDLEGEEERCREDVSLANVRRTAVGNSPLSRAQGTFAVRVIFAASEARINLNRVLR